MPLPCHAPRPDRRASRALAVALVLAALCTPWGSRTVAATAASRNRDNSAASTPATIYVSVGSVGVFRNADVAGPWTAAGGLPAAAAALATGDPAHWHDLYAGLSDGVYVSHDSGASWLPGLHGFAVRGLLVAAQTHAVLAATDHGAYRSTDSGTTWTPTGLSGRVAGVVQVQPASTPTATTAAPMPCYAWSGNRVWSSPDEGQHWSLAQRALPARGTILDVAGNPADATVFAAATNGLWRGVPGGKWQQLGHGLPAGTTAGYAAVAADARHVYATGRADAVLYVSGDGGATWAARAIAGLAGSATAFVDDAQLPGTVLAGDHNGRVLRSADAGATWTSPDAGVVAGAAGTPVLALTLVHRVPLPIDGVADPHQPGMVFVADNGGHTVHAPFLAYWQQYQAQIGSPLTEAYGDPAHPDTQVQIFANMELIAQGGRVTPAPLGLQQLPANAAGTANPTVDVHFAAFVKGYGDLFGPPVSAAFEISTADGTGRTYLAQYFRNARLETHPEYGGAVQVGRLGDAVVHALGWR